MLVKSVPLVFVLVLSIVASVVYADDQGQYSPRQVPSAGVSSRAQALVADTQELIMHALAFMGVNYRFGGKSPEAGLDCSGFVHHVFKEAAGVVLPGTAYAQSLQGEMVRRGQLQPGDLVFFNTLKRAFSHVGIYIGDNRFIHAPRTGKRVEIGDLTAGYWSQRFNGARRIVTPQAEDKPRADDARAFAPAPPGAQQTAGQEPDLSLATVLN
jgi:cell wall-associated NlpC family hydrolase